MLPYSTGHATQTPPPRRSPSFFQPVFLPSSPDEAASFSPSHQIFVPIAHSRPRPRLPSISTLRLPGLGQRDESGKKTSPSKAAWTRSHPYLEGSRSITPRRFSLRETLAKSDCAVITDVCPEVSMRKISGGGREPREKRPCDCCGSDASRTGPRGKNTLCSTCGLSFLRRIKSLGSKDATKADIEDAVQGFCASRRKYLEYKQSKAAPGSRAPSFGRLTAKSPSEEASPPLSPTSTSSRHSHFSHQSSHTGHSGEEDSHTHATHPCWNSHTAYHQSSFRAPTYSYPNLSLPPRLEVPPPSQDYSNDYPAHPDYFPADPRPSYLQAVAPYPALAQGHQRPLLFPMPYKSPLAITSDRWWDSGSMIPRTPPPPPPPSPVLRPLALTDE